MQNMLCERGFAITRSPPATQRAHSAPKRSRPDSSRLRFWQRKMQPRIQPQKPAKQRTEQIWLDLKLDTGRQISLMDQLVGKIQQDTSMNCLPSKKITIFKTGLASQPVVRKQEGAFTPSLLQNSFFQPFPHCREILKKRLGPSRVKEQELPQEPVFEPPRKPKAKGLRQAAWRKSSDYQRVPVLDNGWEAVFQGRRFSNVSFFHNYQLIRQENNHILNGRSKANVAGQLGERRRPSSQRYKERQRGQGSRGRAQGQKSRPSRQAHGQVWFSVQS